MRCTDPNSHRWASVWFVTIPARPWDRKCTWGDRRVRSSRLCRSRRRSYRAGRWSPFHSTAHTAPVHTEQTRRVSHPHELHEDFLSPGHDFKPYSLSHCNRKQRTHDSSNMQIFTDKFLCIHPHININSDRISDIQPHTQSVPYVLHKMQLHMILTWDTMEVTTCGSSHNKSNLWIIWYWINFHVASSLTSQPSLSFISKECHRVRNSQVRPIKSSLRQKLLLVRSWLVDTPLAALSLVIF